MFNAYLDRWGLKPDGDPIVTYSSQLLPVLQGDIPAMLKVAVETEEKFGGLLMSWWGGQGAARVLAHEGDALLMERAENNILLADLARNGGDDEASRIICDAVAALHRQKGNPPFDLIPLAEWFEDLAPAAAEHGGILAACAATAGELLAAPREVVVLHGDVHHQNILDFGPRGWLAIDPKRLLGERGFDYVNLFCNPDPETAVTPGRLARQVDVVVEAAGLERKRLLQWIVAWAGLSAVWWLQDGEPESEHVVADLTVADMAMRELAKS
ncbi:streptomycin 6-kinase [Nitrosospira sp. Nl5]|uniref:aminoglycoside phosphotransferase family protein n=1 Tax=Nitrosospira sp. Nl5 TaxID=200120 RepID=UPI00087E10C1|nr:aminoglycoside phosphotransferase family protein [Nitrosospira sp. Nl5]SCY04883.1 streptomycin 6-kinase [Nitrosospira sp. Nl5]